MGFFQLKKAIILFIIILMLTIVISGEITALSLEEGELQAQQINLEGETISAQTEVVFLYQGITFQSEFLTYHLETEDITMEEDLLIKDEEFELRGEILEGNLAREEVEVKNQVKLTGPELKIWGEQMNYRAEDAEAVFSGEPEIEYQNIWAKSNNLSYDFNTGIARLEGQVEGERNGQQFFAEVVKIDMTADTINLSGNSSLKFTGSEE